MTEPAERLREIIARSAALTPEQRVAAVRDFVTGLDPVNASRLVHTRTDLVGKLNGMPFALRYEANRIRMTADRNALTAKIAAGQATSADTTRLRTLDSMLTPIGERKVVDRDTGATRVEPVHRRFAAYERRHPGRAVEVQGELPTARNVAVLVPGMANNLDNFNKLAESGEVVRDVAGPSTATVVWLGYDSPQSGGAVRTTAARDGGPQLREFKAALDQETRNDARTSLLAHSYGTVVASRALRDGARFDNVVVMGSPGLGHDVDSAADLRLPSATRMYAMRARGDFVSYSQWHGRDPAELPGATRLATGDIRWHSSYYRPRSESLVNLGHVVAGRHDRVTTTSIDIGSEAPVWGRAERGAVVALRKAYDLTASRRKPAADRGSEPTAQHDGTQRAASAAARAAQAFPMSARRGLKQGGPSPAVPRPRTGHNHDGDGREPPSR